ncbi:MAG TPA: NHL repeat-containing protein [Chthonomonadaceae bacterium]|nr:NHL repeat-containing protein [Chthonomonadaceae bacterium]
MSDRFNYLEIGDELPRPAPAPAAEERGPDSAPGWKPLRLRAVEVIGDPGTGVGQFAAPTGLAVDRDGTLYVADSNNHRVQRIALNGDVKVYGRPGSAPGQMWGPVAVAVDPTGQFVYVADQGNNRVQCFHFLGQCRGAIGGFRSPSGVAFDAEGMLWIADTGQSRLLRFNPRNNQFIGGMDQAVGIVRPLSVACDHAHNIYVTDGATSDVTRYTYFGVRAQALGEIRRLADPRGVAVDSQGRIYLAEAGANRLHVFDAQGGSLLTYDSPNPRLGPFRAPSSVALGPNGEIYVADTLNQRIVRLAWD